MPGRIEPEHKVHKLAELGLGSGEGWDDEITFNTQVFHYQLSFNDPAPHSIGRNHRSGIA